MKLFYWMVFGLLLGFSLGFTSKKDTASEKYSYAEIFSGERGATLEAASKRKNGFSHNAPLLEKETDGPGLKVLVIKKTEIKSLVDSIEKKYKKYVAIDRYERIDKALPSANPDQLKIKLTRDVGPAIGTVDKPLVLGGEGFDTAGFEDGNNSLHFTFNSHINTPPIHKIERKDTTGYLDSDFDRARSKKFLIFHDSGLSFDRQSNHFIEPKQEQPVKEKTIHAKIDSISDIEIYPGQDKGAEVHPNPAKKSLDLIYGNPAILKYDYQVLNSGGS